MAKRFENGDAEYPESVVGPSVTIEGDLVSQGNLQVEGTVNGKVKTSRNLYVGEKARIQADINAQNVTVAGVVEGNIKVSELLTITHSGKVLGNISCKRLGVEEGAYFAGNCEMEQIGEAPAQAEEAPEEA